MADNEPRESFWSRLATFFRSRHVEFLEAELQRARERERMLLDRLLLRNGVAPFTPPTNMGQVVPKNTPARPWRRMAKLEAEANSAFQEFERDFKAGPTVEDLMKAKRESN